MLRSFKLIGVCKYNTRTLFFLFSEWVCIFKYRFYFLFCPLLTLPGPVCPTPWLFLWHLVTRELLLQGFNQKQTFVKFLWTLLQVSNKIEAVVCKKYVLKNVLNVSSFLRKGYGDKNKSRKKSIFYFLFYLFIWSKEKNIPFGNKKMENFIDPLFF